MENYQQLQAEHGSQHQLPAGIEQTPDAGPVDTATGEVQQPTEVVDAEIVDPDERADWPNPAVVPS
jgi:hypothetical protein